MIYLLYSNGIVTWDNKEYTRGDMEKIGDMCVHVLLDSSYYAFLGNETTINGVLTLNADDIINALT
jgi:hypothetical protein